jgi:hypothetical protein
LHGDAVEGNTYITINKQVYYLAADGNLMPSKKDQPPPDLRYFNPPRSDAVLQFTAERPPPP